MNALAKRIKAKRRGSVFTPKDFADLGMGRSALDKSLARLAQRGEIRRLAHGIYDKPRTSPTLGPLSPAPDDIAAAIARRDGHVIGPTPARAANALGLTTQMPAKPTYLTDGTTRTLKIGGRDVAFRRAARRNLVGGSTPVGQVVQALRYLGRDGVDQDALAALRTRVPAAQRRRLRDVAKDVPAWMAPALESLAAADPSA